MKRAAALFLSGILLGLSASCATEPDKPKVTTESISGLQIGHEHHEQQGAVFHLSDCSVTLPVDSKTHMTENSEIWRCKLCNTHYRIVDKPVVSQEHSFVDGVCTGCGYSEGLTYLRYYKE